MVRACLIMLLLGHAAAAQEDTTPSWSASGGTRYLSRFVNYGLDLSSDRPAMGYGVSLSHDDALFVSADAIQTLGTGGELQQWSLAAGYEWEVSEFFMISAEFTHYKHSNDAVSVIAPLSNSISLGVEASSSDIDFSFSYDRFFGSTSASFFGFDVSGYSGDGRLSVVPLLQLIVVSQEVENRLLKTGKGKAPKDTVSIVSTTTVTGVSSLGFHLLFLYAVVDRLTISFHPSFQFTPQQEVSARKSLFTWSVGVRYTLDF